MLIKESNKDEHDNVNLNNKQKTSQQFLHPPIIMKQCIFRELNRTLFSQDRCSATKFTRMRGRLVLQPSQQYIYYNKLK